MPTGTTKGQKCAAVSVISVHGLVSPALSQPWDTVPLFRWLLEFRGLPSHLSHGLENTGAAAQVDLGAHWWITVRRGTYRLCHGLEGTGPATWVDPGVSRSPASLQRTWRHRARAVPTISATASEAPRHAWIHRCSGTRVPESVAKAMEGRPWQRRRRAAACLDPPKQRHPCPKSVTGLADPRRTRIHQSGGTGEPKSVTGLADPRRTRIHLAAVPVSVSPSLWQRHGRRA